jgi:hypothetical protein
VIHGFSRRSLPVPPITELLRLARCSQFLESSIRLAEVGSPNHHAALDAPKAPCPPRVALSFYRRYQPVRLLGQGSRYAWAWRSCRRRVGPSGDRQSGTDQVGKSRKGDSRNHGTRHSHRREPCGRASRRTGDHGSGDPPFVPLPPHRWDYHESEEVRFATDSPLEGAGFEPSVPPLR